MNKLSGLILAMVLAGCSTCKSTDSPDVCRTKQREHSQPRANLPAPAADATRIAMAQPLTQQP
jgi:hypothetical protein